MKRLLSVCAFCCGVTAAEAATIWQEDFSSYTNAGVTGQGATNYPAAITNWSIDVSACATLNPGSGSAGDYFMAAATSGGRMEAVNVDGEAVWSSAVISISGYTNVSLAAATSETGSSASTNKYVKLFYRLDGGAETAFAIRAESIGNWGAATAVQSNLYGSTVQIIARVNNPNVSDKSIFDNVIVSGDPVAGNAAPSLDPVGNKSVAAGNALNFSVTASDADNDPIILSARNLPPGAVFNTVTNAGGVTNLFVWSNAAPVGVYTATFCAADGTTNDFETITITVTNIPAVPLTGAAWNVYYNLPQQSSSGTDYPDQFRIRNAFLARINALQNGNSAVLTTFTFSADEGAGAIINAISDALDRGALIRFIADGGISLGTVYGGTNSLLSLSTRPSNPLTLAVASSSSGIMHDKLGLFDYGETNQWVFTASWNFTLAASANQWNIGLEARSPALYAVYANETAEFLAGRFHDDPAKSHAHDGAPFTLDGSWGTNFVRFAPCADASTGGNNAERDITNLIAQAQSGIVFALNKLNRTPIRDALIAAANRGVIVKGVMPKSDTGPGGVSAAVYSYLTNSASYTGTNRVQMLPACSKADYSALDQGESDLVHAKYMVIDPDSTHAIVIHGSANWTYEALVSSTDSDENTVFLRHNGIAAKFYDHFQRITGTGLFATGNSTIVIWNFMDSNQPADGGIPANETQTVARIPAPASYTYTDNALSANNWNSGADTKYWETSFSTLQHTNIKVSSKQTSTTTGPVHFQLQYKTGVSSAYTEVPNGAVTVGTGWGGQLTRLPLPSACDNQTSVFLRWLMTSNIAVNGSPVGSSGASRIDDIVVTGTAYDLPPVLDPTGNKAVFEGLPLSFAVTANDPIDHDVVTLSATNLPTGATFTNGLFTWSAAAPAGAYAVTFCATDKDGSGSETVIITVSPLPQLLISEIADPAGTGGDVYRFVELYNAGTNAINLAADNWYLSRQNNGADWTDIPLTGTVAAAGTYVIAKGTNFYTAYGFYPQQMISGVDGNGNDAYVLYCGGGHTDGTLIDIYGQLNTDGTHAAWNYTDSRAARKNSVLQPNGAWTASEWILTPNAATSNMTPGLHGPVPEFQGLGNPFVFLGDSLSMSVTAANTVRTDVITLSATALPAGAAFATATGTNIVSSTLNWNSPAAGVYTAIFAAAGSAGTNTASVTITVAGSSQMDGYFFGWKNDTIVELKNGQFWKNTGGVGINIDPPLHNPGVTLTNQSGRRMFIEGVSGYKTVERIEINASAVTNVFNGLHYQNIYQLADGTVWKQISSEIVSSNASPVTAWRWIESGVQKMRFFARNNIVIGTCTVEVSAPPADTTIYSAIDGWFRGRQNRRVFVLKNGQFWQQTSLDGSSQTLYSPAVTITNWLQTGDWRMSVDGQTGYISVQEINARRTAIDRWFYGFGRGNIFSLAGTNGWWKQTSSEISTSTRFSPEVLIWSESGTDYLEMPDEGLRVAAAQLDVRFESAVTNAFTGLHYGNLYRLDGDGDRVQLSFENIRTNVTNPSVMLWKDGAQTNMLVRDSRNVTIGACVVIDPIIDSDGDGANNQREVIAGSDPLDAQSRFKITQTGLDGSNHYVLRWNAVEGRLYTIEWTPSLAEPFPRHSLTASLAGSDGAPVSGWQPLENSIAWPQNSWTDTVHTVATKGFYRLGVRLAD